MLVLNQRGSSVYSSLRKSPQAVSEIIPKSFSRPILDVNLVSNHYLKCARKAVSSEKRVWFLAQEVSKQRNSIWESVFVSLNSLALPLSSFFHSFLSSFLMTPLGLCSCTWVFCSFGEWGIYTLVMERGL